MKYLVNLLLLSLSLHSYAQVSLGSKHAGIAFGNIAPYTGLRFTVYDKIKDSSVYRRVNIFNFGLAFSKLDRVNGLSIGVLADNTQQQNGISITGLLSVIGNKKGITISGLGTIADTITGITITPGFIVCRKRDFDGGGPRRHSGMSVSAYMWADEFNGLSIAYCNGSLKSRGLTIGLFNKSDELKGVQLGLINYAKNNKKLFRVLPIMNIHL